MHFPTVIVALAFAASSAASLPSASGGSGLINGGNHTISASGTGHGSPITTPGPPPKTTTVTVPGVTSTTTKTHVITSTSTTIMTKFVPCSSAIATQEGTTYYSSSLTTSLVTSTRTAVQTEYTVVCPTPGAGNADSEGSMADIAKGQGQVFSADHNNGAGHLPANCPPASTVYHTVYVTVAPAAPGQSTPAPGGPGAPSSRGNSAFKPQPPYQSAPSMPPYPVSSSHPSGSLPSGSGSGTIPAGPTATGRDSTRPLPTGMAIGSGHKASA